MTCVWSLLFLAIAGAAFAQGYPDSVVAEIPVGGDPSDIAVLPNGRFAYIANEAAQYVTVVDIENRSVAARVTCGTNPYMIAAKPDGQYVYSTSEVDDEVSVIRTSDNAVVTTIPIGATPHRLCFSPDGNRCYVANSDDNTVAVIRTSDNTVVATVPVGATPRDVDCTTDGQYVYAANTGSSTLTKIRASDNTVVRTVGLSFGPHRVKAMPGGDYVYATQHLGNMMAVVRTSDDSVVATLNMGVSVGGMCFVGDGDYLYVGSAYSGGAALVVRTSDNAIVARIITGGLAVSVRAPADGAYVASCNRDVKSVTVIGYRHQHDVCPTSVLAPAGILDSGTVVEPTVLVKNLGTAAEMFPVTMQIGSGYSVVVQETLPGGSTDTVRFPFWTAEPVGTSPVVCFTGLTGDENPANDTVRDSVQVTRAPVHDVGVVAVLSPTGTVDSGEQVTPTVVVRNFGTISETFPTALSIGSSFNQMLPDTLAAGATDTLRFPIWTAEPVGTSAVVCFTGLTGDENPANNTVRDSVAVRRALNIDVGPVEILSPPGTSESGSVYVPSAMVRNYGLTSAVFPVTMIVGAGYARTAQETLAAGLADTVVFPAWVAEPVGQLAVTCFTALVGDEDVTNDTLRDSVRVVGAPVSDVGAVAIVAPAGELHTGDTVIPRARIRNFGNTVERFFNVRFRIGTSYNRTANEAQTLYPDSVVEMTFAPWVAESGTWAVSCSTMLVSDANRANDKVTSSARVFEQALHIEPDQSDRLELGEGKTFQFYALIDGDTGGVVEVARPTAPVGWAVRLCDSAGADELPDTDGDGIPDLGFVAAGESSRFLLEVQTPSGLAGDPASLAQRKFVIAGHLGNDSMVADTALLDLILVPGFSVHNFPNPLSTSTSFVIGLPADGEVRLTVYTRAGERVCRVLENTDMPAGVHAVPWDAVNDNGRAVAPGTYEYVLDYVHQGKADRIRKRLVVTRQ